LDSEPGFEPVSFTSPKGEVRGGLKTPDVQSNHQVLTALAGARTKLLKGHLEPFFFRIDLAPVPPLFDPLLWPAL